MEAEHLKGASFGKTKSKKTFYGKGISSRPQKYLFTKYLLLNHSKEIFDLTVLYICVCTTEMKQSTQRNDKTSY